MFACVHASMYVAALVDLTMPFSLLHQRQFHASVVPYTLNRFCTSCQCHKCFIIILCIQQSDKTKEEHKKLFKGTSRKGLRRSSLKREFDTIVRNKDKEILMQIEEMQQLNQHVQVNKYMANYIIMLFL